MQPPTGPGFCTALASACVQAVRLKSAPPKGAQKRQVEAATAAVRAVIVYRGSLDAAAHAALLQSCRRGLMLGAKRSRGSGRIKVVQESMRDVRSLHPPPPPLRLTYLLMHVQRLVPA